jgi:hypothetical protein
MERVGDAMGTVRFEAELAVGLGLVIGMFLTMRHQKWHTFSGKKIVWVCCCYKPQASILITDYGKMLVWNRL